MLGRHVNVDLKTSPPTHVWGNVLPIFRSADMRICNLECVIADGGSPWNLSPKMFHFRSDAKNAAVLSAAGIDLVSLANNHTLDYGYDAMLEMLDTLDRAEILHAGAGHDLQAASKPAILTRNGVRIGYISFTDNEPDWGAARCWPGVFHVPVKLGDEYALRLIDLVRHTRSQVDYLIVAAHWGSNWGYRPHARHIPFAHALIDEGADIIFGHSCHVFQAIEVYRSRPIFYSCGDFVDDYRVDEQERNDETFIFMVEIEDNAIQRLLLYPTLIRHCQAWQITGRRAEAIAHKMQKLCAEFKTTASWCSTSGYLEIPISVS